MSQPATIDVPTKLSPVALCLQLPLRQGAMIPLGPSPFADDPQLKFQLRLLTPTDFWLVNQAESSWCLRMKDPAQGTYEFDLPPGLVEQIVDLGRDVTSTPTPRRKKRPKDRPKSAILSGVLATSTTGLWMVITDLKSGKANVELGSPTFPKQFDFWINPQSRRWTLNILTAGQGRVSVPLPEAINLTLIQAIESTSEGPEAD
jgi:hypothetical protein